MATIQYLTTIHVDHGALARVRDSLDELGVRRPLVVTDRGVVAAGLLARLTARLDGDDLAARVFADTPANPTEAAARAAAARFTDLACDGIVAMGGGSAMDLAKAAGLLARQGGALADYALINGGAARIRAEQPPLVAIPTTAGTGSEVGRGAVVILDDGRKLAVISPHLIPDRR